MLDRRKIAENLRSARARSELPQKELATNLGISQSMISRFERGKASMSLEQASMICDALGITIEALVGR